MGNSIIRQTQVKKECCDGKQMVDSSKYDAVKKDLDNCRQGKGKCKFSDCIELLRIIFTTKLPGLPDDFFTAIFAIWDKLVCDKDEQQEVCDCMDFIRILKIGLKKNYPNEYNDTNLKALDATTGPVAKLMQKLCKLWINSNKDKEFVYGPYPCPACPDPNVSLKSIEIIDIFNKLKSYLFDSKLMIGYKQYDSIKSFLDDSVDSNTTLKVRYKVKELDELLQIHLEKFQQSEFVDSEELSFTIKALISSSDDIQQKLKTYSFCKNTIQEVFTNGENYDKLNERVKYYIDILRYLYSVKLILDLSGICSYDSNGLKIMDNIIQLIFNFHYRLDKNMKTDTIIRILFGLRNCKYDIQTNTNTNSNASTNVNRRPQPSAPPRLQNSSRLPAYAPRAQSIPQNSSRLPTYAPRAQSRPQARSQTGSTNSSLRSQTGSTTPISQQKRSYANALLNRNKQAVTGTQQGPQVPERLSIQQQQDMLNSVSPHTTPPPSQPVQLPIKHLAGGKKKKTTSKKTTTTKKNKKTKSSKK